jgi:leader peptidase (prepilin peptidase) / N-methyltransferase
MSAYEDLREGRRGARFIGAHGVVDFAFAACGCLATFNIFEFRTALLVAAWWCLSVVIVRSDLEEFIIPNWATAGIALLGLCYAISTTPGAFTHLSTTAVAIVTPIERGILTFLCVAAFGWAFAQMTGRECLGFGDVKLSSALGLWLCAYDLIITLEIASVAALGLVAVCYLRNKRAFDDGVIPFGAFLAPAAWGVFGGGYVGAMAGPWHALLG